MCLQTLSIYIEVQERLQDDFINASRNIGRVSNSFKLSPPVVDGDDAPNLLGKADEHGVSKIEVLPGKVAPSSKRAVGAEIGGGHCDGLSPAQTILGATGVACEFITSSAAEATVEQSGT